MIVRLSVTEAFACGNAMQLAYIPPTQTDFIIANIFYFVSFLSLIYLAWQTLSFLVPIFMHQKSIYCGKTLDVDRALLDKKINFQFHKRYLILAIILFTSNYLLGNHFLFKNSSYTYSFIAHDDFTDLPGYIDFFKVLSMATLTIFIVIFLLFLDSRRRYFGVKKVARGKTYNIFFFIFTKLVPYCIGIILLGAVIYSFLSA